MKKKIAAIALVIIFLAFSGCSLDIVSSVDSLMRPPKLNGESSFLQEAFEKTVGNSQSVIMKTPVSGENRSSYLLFDIDNNGTDEAIVFYSDPAVDEFAYALIFNKINGEWNSVASVKGKGDEIYEVGFADINGDNNYEIIISWTTLAGNEGDSLNMIGGNKRISTIYSYEENNISLVHSEQFTKMLVEDLNNDKTDELLYVNIDLSDQENVATGKILEFDRNFTIVQNQSFTMSSLIDVYNIVTDTVMVNEKNHTRIFVDGGISESSIITEIIDVSHDTFKISLPLYEKNTSGKNETLRDVRVFSKDIDGDGVVEIPTSEILPGGIRITDDSAEPTQLNLTVWSEYKNEKMVIKDKLLMNNIYGYMFKFDDDWLGKLTVAYNVKNATMTFYELDSKSTIGDKIFSIRAFSELKWDENSFGYTKFDENGAFVYGYIIEDSYRQKINRDIIAEHFLIAK